MESPLTCIAIDDEPLALDIISRFCTRLGGLSLSVYSDPAEGLAAISSTHPAIAFLDIEMDALSGLDIAARLPEDSCFIFTTAYPGYVLKGFELDAVDYLLKPFAFDRFSAAIAKARRRHSYLQAEAARSAPASLTVMQEYSKVTIPFADILYIEAMEGYSKIFLVSGRYVLSRVIIKNLLAMLPSEGFARVHRSYAVALAKVVSYTRRRLTLSDGKEIPVGRQYAADVISRLSDMKS